MEMGGWRLGSGIGRLLLVWYVVYFLFFCGAFFSISLLSSFHPPLFPSFHPCLLRCLLPSPLTRLLTRYSPRQIKGTESPYSVVNSDQRSSTERFGVGGGLEGFEVGYLGVLLPLFGGFL